MEENFHHAVERVLRHEGGYVHEPDDPGGETKFGISRRSYPDLDIRNLTEAQAREIYRRDWWDRYGYGRIHHRELAAQILDLAVNAGPVPAHTMLQRALNETGCGPVAEDGVLGPRTLDAVNRHPSPALLLAELKMQAIRRYVRLARDKSLRKYLIGWICRVLD